MIENINCTDDLKKLSVKQLPQLCREIRQLLIDTIPITGGHLSSNLGVVELTVALHYIFDSTDSIVWDVGHQSYVHKILTGRRKDLSTIRQLGGISGFTDPSESKSDCAISGHASTSISTAIGIATANRINMQNDDVVAVVGDGALTGGLTHEALNNIRDNNMLVVINDNNMSIDKNIGAISTAVSKIRVGKYYKRKEKFKRGLLRVPLLGKPLYKLLRHVKRRLKLSVVHTNYFDHYGVKYIGIVDGHDIGGLIYYLKSIKNNINEPTILHIITQKGKGFKPAEESASKYHNLSTDSCSETSSNYVGDAINKLMIEHNDVVAVTCAMTSGVGFNGISEENNDRLFDVGIAEGHAITFGAGMAIKGLKPYIAIYSTFLQRAFDNLVHDVAIANLPVTLLVDRAGLVGNDGKTHQGLMDLSYLSVIPNMTVWAPYTYKQLSDMIDLSYSFNTPLAIRYSKTLSNDDVGFYGKWIVHNKTASSTKLLCVGSRMTEIGKQVASEIDVEIVTVTTVKPMDESYLQTLEIGDNVFTLEENMLKGGFGSQLSSALSNGVNVFSRGVDDCFVDHATVDEQLTACSLTKNDVINWIKSTLN